MTMTVDAFFYVLEEQMSFHKLVFVRCEMQGWVWVVDNDCMKTMAPRHILLPSSIQGP